MRRTAARRPIIIRLTLEAADPIIRIPLTSTHRLVLPLTMEAPGPPARRLPPLVIHPRPAATRPVSVAEQALPAAEQVQAPPVAELSVTAQVRAPPVAELSVADQVQALPTADEPSAAEQVQAPAAEETRAADRVRALSTAEDMRPAATAVAALGACRPREATLTMRPGVADPSAGGRMGESPRCMTPDAAWTFTTRSAETGT